MDVPNQRLQGERERERNRLLGELDVLLMRVAQFIFTNTEAQSENKRMINQKTHSISWCVRQKNSTKLFDTLVIYIYIYGLI